MKKHKTPQAKRCPVATCFTSAAPHYPFCNAHLGKLPVWALDEMRQYGRGKKQMRRMADQMALIGFFADALEQGKSGDDIKREGPLFNVEQST